MLLLWLDTKIPSYCVCSIIDHALSRRFPIIRHNELRDVAVSLPQEVCHDVCSEPHLQQLSGEVLNGRTSIRGDDARLDISACGFGLVDSNKHFSTSECLTQMLMLITPGYI